MRRARSLRFLASAIAVAALASLSCTGAGDGGVSGTDDYLNRGVTVEPLTPTTTSHVALRETSGDQTTSCISVEARLVSDVFSAAFTVTYDETVLRYTGLSVTSSCLGTAAETLAPQVDALSTPGELVVGFTRNGAVTTTGIDTCGRLIDLCFEVIGEGEFDMDFVGNLALLKPDGTAVDELTGGSADWVSAHVTVRQ